MGRLSLAPAITTTDRLAKLLGIPVGNIKRITRYPDGRIMIETTNELTVQAKEKLCAALGVVEVDEKELGTELGGI